MKIIDFGLSRFEESNINMTTRVGTPYCEYTLFLVCNQAHPIINVNDSPSYSVYPYCEFAICSYYNKETRPMTSKAVQPIVSITLSVVSIEGEAHRTTSKEVHLSCEYCCEWTPYRKAEYEQELVRPVLGSREMRWVVCMSHSQTERLTKCWRCCKQACC